MNSPENPPLAADLQHWQDRLHPAVELYRSTDAAIDHIEDRVVDILAPFYKRDRRALKKAPWFPEIVSQARNHILANRRKLETPDDVDAMLAGHIRSVFAMKLVGEGLYYRSTHKPAGQVWVVDGVYQSSIEGPRQELLFGDIMVRALSGAHRKQILAQFKKHCAMNRTLQDVVRCGVYDRSGQNPRWNPKDLSEMSSLFVTQLAELILWFSDTSPSEETGRGATDGGRDLDFLIRQVKPTLRWPLPSYEDELELKREVLSAWLFEKQSYWRQFVGDGRKGDGLFGVVGTAVENGVRDYVRKCHVNEMACDPCGTKLDTYTLGSKVEIDDSLLVYDKQPDAKKLESDEIWRRSFGSEKASRRPGSTPGFAERARVEHDLKAAFRAVYCKTDPHFNDRWINTGLSEGPAQTVLPAHGHKTLAELPEGKPYVSLNGGRWSALRTFRCNIIDRCGADLSPIGNRDFRVLCARIEGCEWKEMPARIGMSKLDVAAAKKNLQRHQERIFEAYLRPPVPQTRHNGVRNESSNSLWLVGNIEERHSPRLPIHAARFFIKINPKLPWSARNSRPVF